MLTIVGGGPGIFELLTTSALRVLDRADYIVLEPEIRSVLSDRREWLGKVEDMVQLQDLQDAAILAEREGAWLVPGSPSTFAPVRQWMESLDRSLLQYIRIESGIPVAVQRLDQLGMFLPSHLVQVLDQRGQSLIQWEQSRWTGPALEQRIAWREERPLHGRRVILLRAGTRTQRVVRWLADWGAEVEQCPVSRLTDPVSYEPVDAAIRHLERYDWLVFTSVEAVHRWFARLRQLDVDVRQVRARIATVGPETSVAVRERGLIPALMPPSEFSQEGLADAFHAIPMRGVTVLFPGGQLNRQFLVEDLRGLGALVDEVTIYRNQREPLPLSLHQDIRAESIDAVLFTASSQVEYLLDQLSSEDRRHLVHVPAFSIGPLTTRTLLHYGINPVAEASQPSLRILAELVRSYYQHRRGGAD
jgi:uroporphyrinogen-III synthase